MVRMVRMVRSLADRTFQLCVGPVVVPHDPAVGEHPAHEVLARAQLAAGSACRSSFPHKNRRGSTLTTNRPLIIGVLSKKIRIRCL